MSSYLVYVVCVNFFFYRVLSCVTSILVSGIALLPVISNKRHGRPFAQMVNDWSVQMQQAHSPSADIAEAADP